MKKKTSRGAEEEEPRPEAKRQGLKRPEEDPKPRDEHAVQVRPEPYFPEVFLG